MNLRDWGLSVIYVNSDVFGVGLSELIFFQQRTYQHDDGETGRFIGLHGSRRAAGLKMLARRQKAHSVDRPLTEPNVSHIRRISILLSRQRDR